MNVIAIKLVAVNNNKQIYFYFFLNNYENSWFINTIWQEDNWTFNLFKKKLLNFNCIITNFAYIFYKHL